MGIRTKKLNVSDGRSPNKKQQDEEIKQDASRRKYFHNSSSNPYTFKAIRCLEDKLSLAKLLLLGLRANHSKLKKFKWILLKHAKLESKSYPLEL